MQDPHLFFVSSFFPPALTPPPRLIFLYAPESPPSLRETGDLRAQVAMYLGIKKGKIKTVNPAPSDSLGV